LIVGFQSLGIRFCLMLSAVGCQQVRDDTGSHLLMDRMGQDK
jgi:hypothetical protein